MHDNSNNSGTNSHRQKPGNRWGGFRKPANSHKLPTLGPLGRNLKPGRGLVDLTGIWRRLARNLWCASVNSVENETETARTVAMYWFAPRTVITITLHVVTPFAFPSVGSFHDAS